MKVPPSVAIGLALAFLGIGLPLIGVTVNLYLGAAMLLAAGGLLLHAIWNWERAHQCRKSVRVGLVCIVALVFLSLVFFQIRSQYRKKLTQQFAVSSPAPAPVPAKSQVDKTPTEAPALTPAPTTSPARTVPHKQKAPSPPKERPAPAAPIEQSGSANGLVGGNLTQGPGSIAQLGGSNNTAIIGTQDWLLTREQQIAIQAGVAKYPGRVTFSWLPMDPSSLRYVEALAFAFNAAGWEVVWPQNSLGSICLPNDVWDCMGASVAVPNRLDESGKAIISTLSAVIPHLKVLDSQPDMVYIHVMRP